VGGHVQSLSSSEVTFRGMQRDPPRMYSMERISDTSVQRDPDLGAASLIVSNSWVRLPRSGRVLVLGASGALSMERDGAPQDSLDHSRHTSRMAPTRRRTPAIAPRIAPTSGMHDSHERQGGRAVGTGLRFAAGGRILGDAHGKRCGKWTRLPTLWLGSRVLRFSDLDDVAEPDTQEGRPPGASTRGPGDAIGDPEERFVDTPSMLEDQTWLRSSVPKDCALIVGVVLPALDDEPINSSRLQRSDDRGETA